MSPRFLIRGAALALAGWFGATLAAATPPNVLLIIVDDLRPELGCYGSLSASTPGIDRLAASGTVFRRAYCQQALCAPSRASLLTGLRPDSLGITGLSQPVRKTRPGVRTRPQHFREHGYLTRSLGKIYHHANDDNDLGWSSPAWMPANAWNQAANPASAPRTAQERSTAWETADVPDDAYPDGKIASRAVTELRALRTSSQPFFLAIGFLKPHLPFFAPRKYWDLYSREQFLLPKQRQWPAGMPIIAGMNSEELRQYRDMPKHGPIDDEVARTLIHGYHACVSYVDAMVGRVLDELDRLELRENTIIILVGDHGWKLNDYGTWCKHTNHEIDVRVPLIVSAPGRQSPGGPTDAIVELVDIFPTLTELAGLPAPAQCEGISFRPLLSHPGRPWKPAAFSLHPHGNHLTGYTVRDERWRYTEWIDRRTQSITARELYDHRDHVVVNANLADNPAYAGEVRRLSRLLDRGAGWKPIRAALESAAAK